MRAQSVEAIVPAQAGMEALSQLQVAFGALAASRRGVQGLLSVFDVNERRWVAWIPACAGMTERADGGL